MTPKPHHARPRHEASDASPRLLGVLALGLTVILAISFVMLLMIFPSSTQHSARLSQPNAPEPRLQIDEAADLAAMRAREDIVLNGYGWVDRSQGIAHIPIDAAMQQLARTGIPDWPKTP